MATEGTVGFFVGLGHGHYTQFLNFQECFPAECQTEVEWVPLRGDELGDRLSKKLHLPAQQQYARHQMWHIKQGIARHRHWRGLFIAGEQMGLLPIVRRYPVYFYVDLSPSAMRELSPWYDRKLHGKPILRDIRFAIHKHLFRSSAGIFTMSQWAANGIQKDYGLPSDRVHVVLPGANLKRWHDIDRLDRPASRPIRILMVGGQFRLKGGELLLNWAEQTSLTNWELDIVTWPGELPEWVASGLGNPGPNERVSQSLAPRLPQVRVHCGMKANTPEIMSLFEQADIFCLPTQADGSSIASLEAMASGLPVLVGAVGGIPELIKDGETGFLLRRGDASDLKSKLELLISDAALRQSVGCAARKSCEQFYNVERQLHQILQVINTEATGFHL